MPALHALLLVAHLSCFVVGCTAIPSAHDEEAPADTIVVVDQPEPTPRLLTAIEDTTACRLWVDSIVSGMGLREKIGQLLVYTLSPTTDAANVKLLKEVVEGYHVGGLLFGKGEVAGQEAMTRRAQSLARVPLLLTFDGEWGLSMRLKNTPDFPRNRVLGCITNDSLLYEYGREVARQCRLLGVSVNFAPVVDVDNNPDNPVINYRSFGDSPTNVGRKAVVYARGLEDGHVLSVSKHFPGHGDTDIDSHLALPTLPFDRPRLDSIELVPFRQVIDAGLGGIMVGHLAIPSLDSRPGRPASLSDSIVGGLLRDELRFQGLIFTDALAMKGVGTGHTLCLQAIEAGNDLLLAPRRLTEEVEAIVQAVQTGRLAEEVIDAHCRRVLTFKYALRLSEARLVDGPSINDSLLTPYTRDLITRLRQAAVVVVHDRGSMLPMMREQAPTGLLVVGEADVKPFTDALSAHLTCEVVRVPRQLTAHARQSLLARMAKYQRTVVCISTSKLSDYHDFFASYPDTIGRSAMVFFTAAKDMLPIAEGVERASAVVVAHSAEPDVQTHVAQVLTGRASADGRLSTGVGELFPTGAGITLTTDSTLLTNNLAEVDSIALDGIRQGAYPGCQVVVLKDGQTVYNKAFGCFTYDNTQPVSPTSVYDLASLTKTTATLLAVMKLYDEGRLLLTDRASNYLPWLRGTNKQAITVRQLLLHESGLPASLLFYEDAIDPESYTGTLFRATRDRLHPTRIDKKTWANPNFHFLDSLTSKTQTATHTLQVSDSLWLHADFRHAYRQKIIDAPLRDRRYRYSCVGFILLQYIVENLTGMPLDEYVEREFYGPMQLVHTTYRPLSRMPKDSIVPSAVDPFLRKTTVQGHVHDEAAAFQGGVSGNAGLFSNAYEVARIHQMMLDGGTLDGRRYLSPETIRTFTTTRSRISRRRLGFDAPDKKVPAHSPCAPSVSASTYGHTGFTGTCAWVDPDQRLVYVFLCNRTYPQTWNTKLSTLDIRPRIQEAVYKAIFND